MSKVPKEDRSIDSLDPRYRERFEKYLEALHTMFPQFRVIVTETRRSKARQQYLIKTGASKTPHSNHQDGIAMDIALLRKVTNEIDWRPAVYRNVYRILDPRDFGLTSGAHLWGWDEGHLQIVEAQGRGKNLSKDLESYD